MKTFTPSLEARHQPSGLNTGFNGSGLTFADYVARTRDMLAEAHAKTAAADLAKIIDGNAPFELKPVAGAFAGREKPFRRGVLLTHGLTDSPYFMRPQAEFFRQNGFRVMAILLPGHGTQPGDLLDVRWQDWAEAVAYGTDRLTEEVDEIYLAGLSAGAALSIRQSLRDDRVRGLFLFSPALKISPRAKWAKLHKLYSWLIPPAKWVNIMPDCDIYKYESLPKNAAAQMHALTEELHTRLQTHGLNIPVFAAASADDATVDVAATVELMARTQHPSSRLVLYSTEPNQVPPGIPPEKLELMNSVLPKQKILSSAHTAIVLPAADPRYGAAGAYANCAHYYPGDMEKYTACIEHPEQAWQGEVTEQNLKVGLLRRLMYNPNFAALEVSLRRFIEKL